MSPHSKLAHLFLEVRTQIKLYHWQTRIYARHKATDRFIETFEPLVDRFVEAAQGITIAEVGQTAPRIVNFKDLSDQQKELIEDFVQTPTDSNAIDYLSLFRDYMANFELPQSELAQIRDDMLEIVDVTLYLFTLK